MSGNSTGRVLFDWNALRAYCREQREAGARIVFTNGVFDLLHPGHLDSLRRARSYGDILVVGLNTDASVRRLKGPGRPVLPLEQRARVLAALEAVHVVTAFDEDTPAKVVEAVEPHVLVKGGHYAVPEIVGHEFVLGRGGEVHSLPLVPGKSSTEIVSTIKARYLGAP